MNPWLLSGLILCGITALLACIYMYRMAPPVPTLPFEFILSQQISPYDYIVDVCHKSTYDTGHYPGAIHIDIPQLTDELPNKIPESSASILFYCNGGDRSYAAVQLARRLGYYNAQYLVNGDYRDMSNESPMQ